ncbi:MAG: CopG family transcriptional regulator [Actinobacteria bacterium]|nr:CopG family transcriptional regulator [Actinomycetota bacterium]
MPEKQQFNVYLPKELVKAVKHAAVDDGLHLSDLTEQALRLWLNDREVADENEEEAL